MARRGWVFFVVAVVVLGASWYWFVVALEEERARRARAVATERAAALELEGFVKAERATSADLRRQLGDLAYRLDTANAQPDIGVTTRSGTVYVEVPTPCPTRPPLVIETTEALDSPCPPECVDTCGFDGTGWVCPPKSDWPDPGTLRVGLTGRTALAATMGTDGSLWFAGAQWVRVESGDWEEEVELPVASTQASISKTLEAALRRGTNPRAWSMGVGLSSDSAAQARLGRQFSDRWGWYVGAEYVLDPNREGDRFRASGGATVYWGR